MKPLIFDKASHFLRGPRLQPAWPSGKSGPVHDGVKGSISCKNPRAAYRVATPLGPSPRFSAWVEQSRRNVAKVASRWRHCVRSGRPGNRNNDLSHLTHDFNHCTNRPEKYNYPRSKFLDKLCQ